MVGLCVCVFFSKSKSKKTSRRISPARAHSHVLVLRENRKDGWKTADRDTARPRNHFNNLSIRRKKQQHTEPRAVCTFPTPERTNAPTVQTLTHRTEPSYRKLTLISSKGADYETFAVRRVFPLWDRKNGRNRTPPTTPGRIIICAERSSCGCVAYCLGGWHECVYAVCLHESHKAVGKTGHSDREKETDTHTHTLSHSLAY